MVTKNFVRQRNSFTDDGAAEPSLGLRSQRVGWFHVSFGDGRCVWSPQVLQMHGYAPGAAAPGIELALSHVHPEDHQKVSATIDYVRRTRQPFSLRHRILDTHGRVHDVAVIGAPIHDTDATPVGVQGFCVELTPMTSTPGTVEQFAHNRLENRPGVSREDSADHDRRQEIRAATQC